MAFERSERELFLRVSRVTRQVCEMLTINCVSRDIATESTMLFGYQIFVHHGFQPVVVGEDLMVGGWSRLLAINSCDSYIPSDLYQ